MSRPVPAVLGLALLAAIWAGSLPRLAEASFTAHMIVHMAVVAGAAPLLALRLRIRPGGAVAAPLFASLLDLVVVWAWHLPPHEAARAGGAAMILAQGSFLLVGLFLWLSALDRSRGAGSALAGAAALFFTAMHMTLLGVLLALAPLALPFRPRGRPALRPFVGPGPRTRRRPHARDRLHDLSARRSRAGGPGPPAHRTRSVTIRLRSHPRASTTLNAEDAQEQLILGGYHAWRPPGSIR